MDTLFVSMCDTTESYIQWLDLATPYIASYVVQQLPCISSFCVDASTVTDPPHITIAVIATLRITQSDYIC